MAEVINDTFGSFDSGTWAKWDGNSFTTGTSGVGSGVYTVTMGTESNGDREAGIVSNATVDLTAAADCSIDVTNSDNSTWIYASLTQPGDENGTTPQDTENDWYRWGYFGGSYVAQKRVGGGSVSTIASGAAASLPSTYKIDFPASGDDVRFLEDGVEKASDATYALSSRDCYLGGSFFSDTDSDSGSWDNFLANDAAGAGAGVEILRRRIEGY